MKHVIVLVTVMLAASLATAQPAPPSPYPPPPQYPAPPYPAAPQYPPPAGNMGSMTAQATPTPAAGSDDGKPKEPKRGDFDAGGQVRFPNGPDETGKYATFAWVAVDAKARYFLLDSVTVNAFAPLAVKKPGTLMDGSDEDMVGGLNARLDARRSRLPGGQRDRRF